jgi:molybdenum cofactor cytidylyltransferase
MKGHPVQASSVGIVVLAAGGSRRLGFPKQLLVFEGMSLLRRASEVALKAELGPTVVILGARAEEIKDELNGLPLDWIRNDRWEEGMGSSIATGIRFLEPRSVQAALIMLCDQPGLGVGTLQKLARAYFFSGKKIIASRYGDTVGVPALFDRSVFTVLQRLDPKEGAKRLFSEFGDEVQSVCAPEVGFDIDTPEDFRKIQKKKAEGIWM